MRPVTDSEPLMLEQPAELMRLHVEEESAKDNSRAAAWSLALIRISLERVFMQLG